MQGLQEYKFCYRIISQSAMLYSLLISVMCISPISVLFPFSYRVLITIHTQLDQMSHDPTAMHSCS